MSDLDVFQGYNPWCIIEMKIQEVYYSYRIKLAFFKEYNDYVLHC